MSDLAGLGVLVTRPAAQAEGLCRRIEAAGGRALRFPTLAILPPHDPAALAAALARLPACSLAVFTSANAVAAVARWCAGHGGWPAGVCVAAIGKGTARTLAAAGIAVDLQPAHGERSEDLLALPALATCAGARVLLVKGEGGRELLAETLAARGAEVHVACAYRRALPDADPAPLHAWLRAGAVDVVVATSNEALANLFALLDTAGRESARDLRPLVVGARGARLARELGFRPPPLLAGEAGDEAIVAALLAWRATQTPITPRGPQ